MSAENDPAQSKNDIAANKAAFLANFPVCRTVGATLKAIKISRGAFEHWKREDPEFMEAVKHIWADILDEAVEMALKKVGIIQLTAADLGTQRFKWVDTALLGKLVSAHPDFKNDQGIIAAIPTKLEIKGIDAKVLLALASPDNSDPAPGNAEGISMNGVVEVGNKALPPVLQKLADKKAEKAQQSVPDDL